MSGFFTLGEVKERPGVYKRYENQGSDTTGAAEKVAACVVQSNWGPLNTPIRVDRTDDLTEVIGAGNGASVLSEIFYEGPAEAYAVRVGTGGTKAAITLKTVSGGTEADAITVTAKHPGNRSFSITVRAALDDSNVTEAILYEGTRILESRSFSDTDEVAAFVSAFSNSKYIDAAGLESASGKLKTVTQSVFTAGTNPTVNTEAYSTALCALESVTWHYLCVDSTETTIHGLVKAFIDRIYEDGAYGRCVLAEAKSVALDTRIANAKAFNDEKVIYVLNSWIGTNGKTYDGYLAAARICGMLAACPSNSSLTHAVIGGAATLGEALTNSQIKKALRSGCLVISMSKSQQVIIEKGINTLVALSENQDAGWKKIKRVDVRFELMDRVEKITDPMIGKVNNDNNGRAAIIAAAQRIVDAMIGEGKLLAGTCQLDNSTPPVGDSAWFRIAVDDIDSIETIYLTFGFRFSQPE